MSKYEVPIVRSPAVALEPHQDSPSTDDWSQWAASQTRPLAIDLFSGAGGLSFGLEAAGFCVALAVDLDEFAVRTHEHNFAGLSLKVDLAAPELRDGLVETLSDLDVALIAGGPPCQPYSRAGRSKIRHLVATGTRAGQDLRRELWQAYLDMIERVRPQAVLMENVPDMALGDDFSVLRVMMQRLEAAGYDTDASLVNAWSYGVPQHRQRLIMVATRVGGEFRWPKPTEKVTLREAIGDLPELRTQDGQLGEEKVSYWATPDSDFQRRARKSCTGELEHVLYDHVTRAVRPDDARAFEQMDSRTRYSDLPEDLRRYRSDIFDDKYKRLGWNDLSRSITAHIAKDGYWYIHPDQHRTLSVREAARIQTFPDHFRFAGSRSHQFRQIGNAVPPALGEAIGSAVLDALRSETTRGRRQRRADTRELLDDWAQDDKKAAPWWYSRDPWVAVVGLIFDARATGWLKPDFVLRRVPSPAQATEQRLTVLRVLAGDSRAVKGVVRLAAAAEYLRGARKADWSVAELAKAARLGPAQSNWLDGLSFETNRVVASSATLRVVARLVDEPVDKERRLSDGRMELAKLIGVGDLAPQRNAALHRLGTVICRPATRECHRCPLRGKCPNSISLLP